MEHTEFDQNPLEGIDDLSVGVALFDAIKISPAHLQDPMIFAKFLEIVEFLNAHPDPHYIISRTMKNKSAEMDNLDYLHSYIRLNKKEMELEQQIGKVKEDMAYYE